MHRAVTRPIIWFVVVLLAGLVSCSTQESVDTVPTPPVAPTREGAPPSQREGAPPSQREELEQLVAPVALYPDALLAQIFMASTYPLEVVEAARWVGAHPQVTGAQLEAEMQQQSWDPSVKSLTAFPQVLTMMNDKLDWTQKLGDAFLAQQKDVMDAVQRLRAKAQAQGNLQSTKEQQVVVEPAPAQTATTTPTIIQIEPTDPQVVYVPTYDPGVVYGPWPYPAYPPYYWYPPGYVAGAGLLSFSAGLVVGAALWGNCDWRGGDVNINIDRYSQFTKIDRANVRNTWQHNAEHRRGTPYRDRGSQQRFGQRDVGGAQTREAFRGRAEQGRQELARGGQGPGQTREAGAFSGIGNGAQARTYSDRGYSSRGGGGGFSGYSGGSDRGGGGFSRGSGGFSHGGGFSRGGGGDEDAGNQRSHVGR